MQRSLVILQTADQEGDSQLVEETTGPDGPESTMRYWIIRTLREAREGHVPRVSRAMIARHLEVDQSTIYRLEEGLSPTTDTDRYVIAYSEVLGVTALELWSHAVGRWTAVVSATPASGDFEVRDSDGTTIAVVEAKVFEARLTQLERQVAALRHGVPGAAEFAGGFVDAANASAAGRAERQPRRQSPAQ